jgi:hypothetical protein
VGELVTGGAEEPVGDAAVALRSDDEKAGAFRLSHVEEPFGRVVSFG